MFKKMSPNMWKYNSIRLWLNWDYDRFESMIEEVKSVVFEKDELEYQDIPTPKTLFTFCVNQDSISNVGEKFMILKNELSLSNKKSSIETFWKEKKLVELTTYNRLIAFYSLSGLPGLLCTGENQRFSIQYAKIIRQLQDETFRKVIKSLALETKMFEIRDESLSKIFLVSKFKCRSGVEIFSEPIRFKSWKVWLAF